MDTTTYSYTGPALITIATAKPYVTSGSDQLIASSKDGLAVLALLGLCYAF